MSVVVIKTGSANTSVKVTATNENMNRNVSTNSTGNHNSQTKGNDDGKPKGYNLQGLKP